MLLNTAVAASNLNIGQNNINLLFDGSRIFQQSINGPYSLSLLRLDEDDGFTTLPVDELHNVYKTATYSYQQFQRPFIYVPGTGTDAGIDLNNNKLFDVLKIDLDIDMVNEGKYNWSARLTDTNNNEIGFISNSGYLVKGKNTVSFTFDGRTIGDHKINGQYMLTDLLVYNNVNSTVIPNAYQTQNYNYTEFEGFIIGDLDNDRDVDLNDINIINSYRNKPVSACPACDLDGDGKITVLDSRKAVLLCTRPNCAVS